MRTYHASPRLPSASAPRRQTARTVTHPHPRPAAGRTWTRPPACPRASCRRPPAVAHHAPRRRITFASGRLRRALYHGRLLIVGARRHEAFPDGARVAAELPARAHHRPPRGAAGGPARDGDTYVISVAAGPCSAGTSPHILAGLFAA